MTHTRIESRGPEQCLCTDIAAGLFGRGDLLHWHVLRDAKFDFAPMGFAQYSKSRTSQFNSIVSDQIGVASPLHTQNSNCCFVCGAQVAPAEASQLFLIIPDAV